MLFSDTVKQVKSWAEDYGGGEGGYLPSLLCHWLHVVSVNSIKLENTNYQLSRLPGQSTQLWNCEARQVQASI